MPNQPSPLLTLKALPAFPILLAYVGGMLTAYHWIISWPIWLLILAGSLVLAGIVYRLYAHRLLSLLPLFLTGATLSGAFALGGICLSHAVYLPPHALVNLVPPDSSASLTLSAEILSPPISSSRWTRVIARSHEIYLPDTVLQTAGNLQLWIPASTDSIPLTPGHTYRISGKLNRPSLPRNPADFNFRKWFQAQGIHAQLWVKHITPAPSPSPGIFSSFRATLYYLQQYIQHIFTSTLPHVAAQQLFAALILGKRSDLPEQTRTAFSVAGVSHVLAISGLHVMLIAFVFYRLLRISLMRLGFSWHWVERIRTSGTLLLLMLYLLVSGGSISATRATIMMALFMGSVLFQRPSNPLNTLSIAAFIILLIKPLQLFQPGFQLSFAAVASLVGLMPSLHLWLQPLPRMLRSLLQLVGASGIATLGTFPILLYHFGQVSWGGLLLNILVIPLTTLALLSILPVLYVYPIYPPLAHLMGYTADQVALMLLYLVRQGALWLQSLQWQYALTHPALWLAYGAGILALAYWRFPRKRYRLLIGALISLTCWYYSEKVFTSPTLQVLFIDVGQGDATLMISPTRKSVLIDTGPPPSPQECKQLVAQLKFMHVRSVHTLILSHPHADHEGAFPCVSSHFPVQRVLTNGQPYHSAIHHRIERILDSLNIPTRAVQAGDTLYIDRYLRGYVLAPFHTPRTSEEANEWSVVTLFQYFEHRWLFLGDINREVESRLIQRYRPLLPSHVVKVAHHGSQTSSLPAFVSAVTDEAYFPRLALVGVSARNSYGLPDAEALDAWKAAEWTLLPTSTEGGVWLASDGHHLWRILWRRESIGR